MKEKEKNLFMKIKDVKKVKLLPTGILFRITSEGSKPLVITPDTLDSNLSTDLSTGLKRATVVAIGDKVEDINIGDILISMTRYALGGEYTTVEDNEDVGYIIVQRHDVLIIVDGDNYE